LTTDRIRFIFWRMPPTEARLIEALESDMVAMAGAALALSERGETAIRDELYARIRADGDLIREVRTQ
jgi:hypothetical protein